MNFPEFCPVCSTHPKVGFCDPQCCNCALYVQCGCETTYWLEFDTEEKNVALAEFFKKKYKEMANHESI